MATKKTEKVNPEQAPDIPVAEDDLAAENEALKKQVAALQFKIAGMEERSGETEAATPVQAAPKMVKIKLPLTRTERDDVFVGLNGKTYLIKRGVEVEVPEGVVEILNNREQMLSLAMEFEAQASAPLDELEKLHQ